VSYFEGRREAPEDQQTEVLEVAPAAAPRADRERVDRSAEGPVPGQQAPSTAAARLGEFRARIAGAFQSFDRTRVAHPSPAAGPVDAKGVAPDRPMPEPDRPFEESAPQAVIDEVPPRQEDSRFPVAPLGYNRAAVDERISELEQELDELRIDKPPVSITEEIERLGEQTASILVVAHDQAHETTRRAQEQADQCIADAAANAVSMTAQARRQLQELDNETDAVWRERQRLLDDARDVGLALIALSEESMERFPPEGKETAASPTQYGGHPQGGRTIE
jgi:hypothetical protein